jgi:hypothetical protein
MLIDHLNEKGLEIGDKIRQLISKSDVIINSGGVVNRRMILPGSFFNRFVEASEKDGQSATDNKIRRGTFSNEEIHILSKVGERFGDVPVMVRMSALGDQYGTGIYHSTASPSSKDPFLDSIKHVLASYFAPDGVAFRESNKLGEGFGISIEPLLGQKLGWDGYLNNVFAPILSGVGYSSGCNGGLRIICASGLFGAVDKGTSLLLNEGDDSLSIDSAVEEYWINLTEHLREQKDPDCDVLARGWLRTLTEPCGRVYAKKVFGSEEFIDRHTMVLEGYEQDGTLFDHLGNFGIRDIFETIERIQDKIGKPQYVEFAYLLGKNGPIIAINQIADEIVREGGLDYIPTNDQRLILQGECKSGEINDDVKYVVFCDGRRSVEDLWEINRSGEKYVAVIPTHLMDQLSIGRSKVGYDDYSNATGVFTDTNKDLGTHFPGIFNATGKILAVSGRKGNGFQSMIEKFGDKNVYEGNFKVLGSVEDRHAQVYNQS